MGAALPAERPGHAAPADLLTRRAGIAAAVAAGMWRVEPAPEEIVLGGVRCLRFGPSGPPRGTILHLHGGAFRVGCPEQVAAFAAALATACHVAVICPAYRLAPEHPYPAGLADAFAVLRALGTGTILLSGDSAGGGLAASLAALALADGIAIDGLILLSAWLDLTVRSACYERNAASDPIFSRDAATTAAALYLQGSSALDPLVSPLFGAVAGYPPSFVSAGAGEVLADDARGFHARLQQARVSAILSLVPGMEHVAVVRGMALTGSVETFAALAAFVAGVVR